MHSVVPENMDPVTKDNYQFLICLKTTIDFLKGIENNEGIKR